METAKVSVIIPIYNVEPYIERCACSLLAQTLDDVQYIFVDDASPDNSLEVLRTVIDRYPEKKTNCTIINHERNKGLPAARNTGLSHAVGEYIYHCDSDDYLETNALETLYHTAKQQGADIVWCDIYEEYSNTSVYLKQPDCKDADDALKRMLTSGMRFNVWNKLCKRTLYTDHEITFLEGNSMGEDMSMMKLFVHANKVAHTPTALYHYIKCNPGALTKTQLSRLQEDKNNIKSLSDHCVKYCGKEYNDYIGFHTLWTKLPLLLTSGKQNQYTIWKEWSPEYNSLIPHLPNANYRIKWLMHKASTNQWWIVWLHYILIVKCYYSIRYRKRK